MPVNSFNLNFRPDLLEALITRAKYPSRIKKDHPQLKLPSDIQELATRADNGSIKNLRALGTKVENESDAPLCLYPEIIDTLFHHVLRPPPASSDAASDKDHMELARASLHGIGLAVMWNMSCGCFETDGSLLISKLVLSWPMLWEWMKYIYYFTENGLDFSFDADSRPLTASRLQSMIDIQGIISWAVYWSPPSLYNIVIATPGLILLLGEIWTRQSDRPRNDSHYRDAHLLNTAFFKAVKFGPNLKDFDLLMEAVCNGPAKLRHVMLKPLQLAAYGGQSWSFSYPSVLGVYSALSRRCPRLCNVLPLVDIMLAICHALTMLSFVPPPRSPPMTTESFYKEPDVDTCVNATCDLVFALSQTRDDFMWINTAIRNDFIPSILRSGLRVSNDDTVNSINAVFEFIRIHLCYRTILRSLMKVIASASVATLASKIPRNNKLALVWERFSSAVRVELEAKTVFDERRLKYVYKCSSPQCRVIEVTNAEAFRLCSKCHLATYCSKSCQKQDWKNGGHRRICDVALHGQQESKLPPISIRDLKYFSFLTDREMVRDQENIIRQRDSILQTTGVSVQSLVLLHDRTLPPLNRFTVSLPSTLDPRTVANYELWTVGAAVPSQNPVPLPMMFTFIRVPFGKHRVLLKIRSREAGPLFGWIQRPGDPQK